MRKDETAPAAAPARRNGRVTAAEAKDALRRRHPATQYLGSREIHGCWTCVEEYQGIDLLAFSAHATPASGRVPGVRYPRVGYEVKVSRADYRRELLAPHKRARNVAWCNAFYFAVPVGLLTERELSFQEPDGGYDSADFQREPCPNAEIPWTRPPALGRCYNGLRSGPLVGPPIEWQSRSGFRPTIDYPCEACDGRGWLAASRVEREAPHLWVPPDVGLISITDRGCFVTRPSPVRKDVDAVDAGRAIADLIRWVSVRPDPRHAALRDRPLTPA